MDDCLLTRDRHSRHGAQNQLIAAGKATFEGDRTGFDQLRAILVPFTPDFEIMPGTAAKAPTDAPKPFEVRDLANPLLGE